jgi:hypothetical protein
MIDYSKFAIPKTNLCVKLSPYEYQKQKEKVWERQGCRCRKCQIMLPEVKDGQLHHPGGRGLGGGRRRDDRTVVLCEKCHWKIHEG